MKKSVYISGGNSGKWLLLFLLTELAGIAVGSFMALHFRNSGILQKYICPELFGGGFFEVFTGTLLTFAVFLVLAFFFGLSVFGQPFGIALLICLGAELSCSAALIYAEKGISALPAVLLMYMPKMTVISAVGLLSVRELMRTSTGLLKSMTSAGDTPNLRSYCMRYAVLFSAAVIISLADALVNNFFSVSL